MDYSKGPLDRPFVHYDGLSHSLSIKDERYACPRTARTTRHPARATGKNPPLSEKEREDLNQLAEQIDAQIKLENATQDHSLADNLNLAVERFEVEHPTLAGTLRNIVQTLGNIGI